MDKREFRAALKSGDFEGEHACHSASGGLFEHARRRWPLHDGQQLHLLEGVPHFALEHKIPLVYASTAAMYGASTSFTELPKNERPLNIYGFSKLVFDN